MPVEADAKILTAAILLPLPGKLEETTRTSSYNVAGVYSTGSEIQEPLPE